MTAATTVDDPGHAPALALRLSDYHVASDVVVDGTESQRIVMATRTGHTITVPASLWDSIRTGDLVGLDATALATLCDAELLVAADEDEFTVIVDRSDRAAAEATLLRMVIQPTAACQLDCSYCGQEHTSARLCRSHQDALVERLRGRLGSGEHDAVSIGWFGAEPLLALDVIRDLTPRIRDLAEAHGCSYDASMVTNGLRLTAAVAHQIALLGVTSVEVTLDGPAEWHDRQRPFKSGRSSFERIVRNLMDIATADADLRITLRCNVTEQSAPAIAGFIDMLAETGLQRRLAHVYFAPIHSWGNGASSMALEKETFAATEAQWRARLLRHGFAVPALPRPKPIVCLATTRDAEVVDAHGDIFNCSEVSYVPTYGSPNRHALGSLDAGTEPARRTHFGDFNRRIETGDVPCRTCRMLPICGGSCPKAWIEGDQPCPPFKWNMSQLLLLELAQSRARRPEVADPGSIDVDAMLERWRARTAGTVPAPPPQPEPSASAVVVAIGPTRRSSRRARMQATTKENDHE